VTAVEAAGGHSDADVLRYAAAVERGSEHPLAEAVIAAADARGLQVPAVSEFAAVPGQGVSGIVDAHRIVLGNVEMLRERGIDGSALAPRADALRQHGQTVLLAAIDGRIAGVIAVADPIRPSAAEMVSRLKAEGLRLLMLTGDHHATAAAIANELGLDDFRAEVTPAAKRDIVAEL